LITINSVRPHEISKCLKRYKIIYGGWLVPSPHYNNLYEKFLNIDIRDKSSYELFREGMLITDVCFDINNIETAELLSRYYYPNDTLKIQTIKNEKITLFKYDKIDNDK
jgi:hypothetical protein